MSAVRHKMSTKLKVVELYEAGWKPAEIERILHDEGMPVPSRNTMWIWTHPKAAAEQARRDVAVARRWRVGAATFAWPGVRTPEWKVGRMRALRQTGMSFSAITKVMNVDFPNEPLTEDEVRYAIHGGKPPICLRRAA